MPFSDIFFSNVFLFVFAFLGIYLRSTLAVSGTRNTWKYYDIIGIVEFFDCFEKNIEFLKN